MPLRDLAVQRPLALPQATPLRVAILSVVGIALLTLSAKINIPLPYVPMTLQTLVVLLIGAACGWRFGPLIVLAYLALGALGLPVFAGPRGGLAPLTGPTAGFLFGFLVAAGLAGWMAERGWNRSIARLLATMALGHLVILTLGFLWLAFGFGAGAQKAFAVGVTPFLGDALVKTALGALLMAAAQRLFAARGT